MTTYVRHRYGVETTTTQTRVAFARYGLTGHADPDDGITPGHWEPAGCEDYEAAVAIWGGLKALTVYSGCSDMGRESFTEWGAPGGRRPVAAGIVRHPSGNGCFHLVYVPDPGLGDPHEMLPLVVPSLDLPPGDRYQEVRPAALMLALGAACTDRTHYWSPPARDGVSTPCVCGQVSSGAVVDVAELTP